MCNTYKVFQDYPGLLYIYYNLCHIQLILVKQVKEMVQRIPKEVPDEILTELDGIREGIISGEIVVPNELE